MIGAARSSIHDVADLERFTKAAHYVTDFVSTYKPNGGVLALFYDETDGFFAHVDLDFPILNQTWWDSELFLRPLATAMEESGTYGIVLVDRNNMRLFSVFLGRIEEHVREGFGSDRVRHIKTVGTDYLESASRVQRKADEQIRLNLRHVAKLADWLVDSRKLNHIILAGTPEVTAELKELLPKRLALRVIGTIDIGMEATTSEVLAATRKIAKEYERADEMEAVKEVVTAAEKEERAVIGLGHTLKAVNFDRVWELVYSDDFHAPGYECSRCAALFSIQKETCQYCGAKLHPISDVVERVVDHALRNGARVKVVTKEASSSLDTAGGIGAFLKTRTGTLRM
jgi:peptide subunit release factor 1 (eRF1)